MPWLPSTLRTSDVVLRSTLNVRGVIISGVVLVACGPVVDPPSTGSTGAPHGSTSGDEADDGPPSAEAGAFDGTTSADDDGGDGEVDDGGVTLDDGVIPSDLPADDPPNLCDVDPYALDPWSMTPYRFCMRGLVDLSLHQEASGLVGYNAYAQFYTVMVEADIEWQEEIVDPFDGTLDDCGYRRYGNSGSGTFEEVLWEDAGDVTFMLDDLAVPGEEYGDPVSVIGYDANPGELGVVPAHLAPHGMIATGDTTPPMDLEGVVVLPELIELSTPAMDGSAVVDHTSFDVQWEPSTHGVPIEIAVNVQVSGDWDIQMFCRVVDDGDFRIPGELAQLLPLPTEAGLWMRRADIRVVPVEDLGVLVTASASTNGSITIE